MWYVIYLFFSLFFLWCSKSQSCKRLLVQSRFLTRKDHWALSNLCTNFQSHKVQTCLRKFFVVFLFFPWSLIWFLRSCDMFINPTPNFVMFYLVIQYFNSLRNPKLAIPLCLVCDSSKFSMSFNYSSGPKLLFNGAWPPCEFVSYPLNNMNVVYNMNVLDLQTQVWAFQVWCA
jgi:hypothetical protein